MVRSKPCKCVCRADQRLSLPKPVPGLPFVAMQRCALPSVRACILFPAALRYRHPTMAACPGCRDRPARPENDYDAYHTPKSRRNAERAAVCPAEPRRQCRRPDRAGRRQWPRQIHPAALHGRRHGGGRRRNHEIPGADDRLCRAACAGSSDGPAVLRSRARYALRRPATQRKADARAE